MNSQGQPSRFHITGHPERVRVLFQGHELADSDDVLCVSENGAEPVFYFPCEDVQVSSLRRNDHTTRCPWKGVASYYTIMRDGHVIEDIAWTYEHASEEAEAIAGRIAFDPRHVDFQVESAPEERVVRHVPAHDPPYAEDLDPADRREIPPEQGIRG
ncbi:MAG TPA: DUF427 domain-containing protein [Caulobacteraceae bacterium]